VDIIEEIKQQIQENNIILFMKGTPEMPQCGFSMQTSQALQSCNAQYAHVDVLSNPDVRQNLPSISNWPTFPQVFVKGELIGGCDIVLELFKNGELQKIIDEASI
jgi:monothiol glutaredoxin